MVDRNWIAYVGNFPFPSGRASSRRVSGVASALVEAGYNVVVLSEDTEPADPCVLFEKKSKGTLSYLGVSEKLPKEACALRKAYRYLIAAGERKVRWLDEQPTKPSHVIYYGSDSAFMLRLRSWCRKNDIPLIVDVVEWRDPSHMVGGCFSPLNISDKFCMRFLIHQANGVIAVSSYLEKFYLNRNSHVIRVPTIIDTGDILTTTSNSLTENKNLTLAYTGDPGKGRKDLLNTVIEALFRLNAGGKEIRFVIVGPTAEDILDFPALHSRRITSLPPWIKALGWQPSEKALEIARNANYMPLLRPENRVSEAGFPTKFVESMAVGTPVICNLTSDLGRYVQDGLEGLVCPDNSVASFIEAVERTLALSTTQYANMRKAARARAERSFDYRTYVEPLGFFLRGLKKRED